jgi:hypothetical protein
MLRFALFSLNESVSDRIRMYILERSFNQDLIFAHVCCPHKKVETLSINMVVKFTKQIDEVGNKHDF